MSEIIFLESSIFTYDHQMGGTLFLFDFEIMYTKHFIFCVIG